MTIESRPYQTALTDGARDFYRGGGRSLIIQAATGSGKSHMGASACASAIKRGHPVFWITHRRELIDQVHGILDEYEVPHSYIAASYDFDPSTPAHICSLETLRRRLDSVRTPKFIVWDEARHIGAATWKAVYERFDSAWHLGLDATPQRNDQTGLGQFFQKMLCGPSMSWLIENGYLAKYRIFAPTTPGLSGLHTRAGEYVTSELEEIFDAPKIVGDAVSHYQKFCAGRRALVFCVSIEASQHQAAAFRAAGFSAVHVDGGTDKGVRKGVLADFRAGLIQIICSVDLFTEGLDVVGVEAIVQLRPTQSRALYLQMIGRGLRPAPGKTDCILLDACANWQRHGLPDDPYEWALTYETRKSKPTIGVKVCPECWAAIPQSAQKCPECGHVYTDTKPREIEQIDGELAELTAEQAQKRRERMEQGRASTLEELQEIGRRKGYNERWALHVYQAKMAKVAKKELDHASLGLPL